MEKITVIIKNEDGTVAAEMVCLKRTFSSGKKGFGAYGKVTLQDGTRLQVSGNFVIPNSEVSA